MHSCKLMFLGLGLAIHMMGAGALQSAIAQTAPKNLRPSTQTGSQQPTAEVTRDPEGGILLNFNNADIRQFIKIISNLTGKNFLVDEKVQGKVTVLSPKPVSLDEAYQVFLSILEVQGFTAITEGPAIKIVPAQQVQQRPLPTALPYREQLSMPGEAFITQLIPLAFANVTDMHTLLTPLVSKDSSLLAYAPTNTLIVTERASNIKRLLDIIRALDVATPTVRFRVIRLRHALAEDLATALGSVLGGLAHAGQISGETPTPAARPDGPLTPDRPSRQTPKAPTKIIADPRTNSLVAIATPSEMTALVDLISALDVPTPEGQGQLHVRYLDHIDAEELAQVLTAQATDIARVTGEPEGQRPAGPPGAPPVIPPAGPPPVIPGLPPGGVLSGVPSGRRDRPAGRGLATGTTSTGITITAHRATNSLIITAPPQAYALMEKIIEKLDIRRSQVLIESLIAEVSLDQAKSLGVEWRVIDNPDDPAVFSSSLGSGSAAVLNSLGGNPLNAPPGFLIGTLGSAITIAGKRLFNIEAILQASQDNTDINILANPNLLAIDNEEAQIVIGENRPFLIASTTTPAGGTISTSRAFEFRDTGITLRVKPKLSKSGTIRLTLFLELTAFVSEAETGAVTTSKRNATTSVIVDNGQTIIVGGLIRDDNTAKLSMVPCLGNLPLFGWLFKQTSQRHTKTNLLIFLTPHIVATEADVRRLTEQKRLQSGKPDELQEHLRQQQSQDNLELLLN